MEDKKDHGVDTLTEQERMEKENKEKEQKDKKESY